MVLLLLLVLVTTSFAQDWKDYPVPADAGEGLEWILQEDVSDDFNYDFAPSSSEATIGEKWTNWFHNGWSGPLPTVWKRDHIYVEDGKMKVKASRTEGETVNVNSGGTNYILKTTNLGCATSVKRVKYPVYIETYVKITKSVLASDVWLLSPDDTQEIDICEAYGGDRWTNDWFSNQRLHLSHHVFIRNPFQDWQPSDEGSFYTDGTTVWSDDYHRIGVYWKDPWNLEYFVDGKLVRTRSGKSQIDPNDYTNGLGLSKPMDIIINTEDQTWRAVQGLTPTDEELQNEANTTFNVDWVRIYKPVDPTAGPVSSLRFERTEYNATIGEKFYLDAIPSPQYAADVSVSWSSDNTAVATVSDWGNVDCKSEGTAVVTATTSDGQNTAICTVTVSGGNVEASISFDDEAKYLSTSYVVGSQMEVVCNFNAGTGNTVVDGGVGGVKFFLREVTSSWNVVNDYVISDSSAIGETAGTARAVFSLENVTPTAELAAGNQYFLYMLFYNSTGQKLDKGILPITITKPTGITQALKTAEMAIYPNPTNGYLKIVSKDLMKEARLSVFNSCGLKIISEIVSGFSHELHLDNQPNGLYLVTVNAGQFKWSKKIIVN